MSQPSSSAARTRLKLLGAAALALLLSGCGDGIPKDKDDDDDGPAPTPALSVFAGDPAVEGTLDGNGGAARFSAPHGLAIDSAGNLYVADRGNFTIRKITPAGAVTTLAGAAGRRGTDNGSAGNARFFEPVALAVNGQNTVYVADGRSLRTITSAGQVATAYTAEVGSNVSEGSMSQSWLGAVAVDGNGNLFMTNGYGTRRLASGNAVLMLEGDQVRNDLSGTREFIPRGVAVDGNGNLTLLDLERKISRLTPNGFGSYNAALLAGAPNTSGAANGTGADARFERVLALTVDPQGNVYAADAVNNLIRRITPAGVVTTVAGTTRANVVRTGGLPGSLADLRGIVADGKGNLYATSGHAIVKIRLP